jgi:hypothetical protein
MPSVKPTAVTSPGGDQISVAIGPSGQTTLRSANPKEALMGRITVRGLTHAEATSKKRGFWGRLWDGIKAAVRKVIDTITFDVGGASCRPSVSVGTTKGRITSVTVGISCIN